MDCNNSRSVEGIEAGVQGMQQPEHEGDTIGNRQRAESAKIKRGEEESQFTECDPRRCEQALVFNISQQPNNRQPIGT